MTLTWNAAQRFAVCLILLAGAAAQAGPPQAPRPAGPPPPAPAASDDYSGMYTFLQEGEFVQLDVEAEGKVSGFVSRYGNLESDKGLFLDHFIKTGTLRNRELAFATAPIHGVWYEFKGRVGRGEGKTRAEEGYYVLKGTVTEFTTNAVKELCGGKVECAWKKVDDKTYGRSREVTLKSFPQDSEP